MQQEGALGVPDAIGRAGPPGLTSAHSFLCVLLPGEGLYPHLASPVHPPLPLCLTTGARVGRNSPGADSRPRGASEEGSAPGVPPCPPQGSKGFRECRPEPLMAVSGRPPAVLPYTPPGQSLVWGP